MIESLRQLLFLSNRIMAQNVDINKMNDMEIVKAILQRDSFVTKEYFYKKCFPLFNFIYKKYYTDCENCIEFINEIYLFIVTPQRKTGKSKLEGFSFKCSLTYWIKIVTENYCKQLYVKYSDILEVDIESSDIIKRLESSLEIDSHEIDMHDVRAILASMPNQRYRALIAYRYVDGHSNENTANLLNMSMPNYYNKHKLAKAQFIVALRKEGLV